MKKVTIGLITALLVITINNSAWAHSGLQIDLGGRGIGFSVYDGHSAVSTFPYNTYRPYPRYSGYYPNRPYFGWGGYSGHHHHNQKHWGHHRSGHHHKPHHYGHQRHYRHGGHGQHHRNHHRQGHHKRRW